MLIAQKGKRKGLFLILNQNKSLEVRGFVWHIIPVSWSDYTITVKYYCCWDVPFCSSDCGYWLHSCIDGIVCSDIQTPAQISALDFCFWNFYLKSSCLPKSMVECLLQWWWPGKDSMFAWKNRKCITSVLNNPSLNKFRLHTKPEMHLNFMWTENWICFVVLSSLSYILKYTSWICCSALLSSSWVQK